MKKHFIVSLVKNGILGGSLTAEAEALTYHTGKLTVPPEYRHFSMKYADICQVTKGWLFILPTVTVKMHSGEEYKFAVFFSRKCLVNTLTDMGVGR